MNLYRSLDCSSVPLRYRRTTTWQSINSLLVYCKMENVVGLDLSQLIDRHKRLPDICPEPHKPHWSGLSYCAWLSQSRRPISQGQPKEPQAHCWVFSAVAVPDRKWVETMPSMLECLDLQCKQGCWWFYTLVVASTLACTWHCKLEWLHHSLPCKEA